ncbi:hypothetical protein VTP01DRAFT_5608 [Rhizomucor pusillus]|uniref:mitochondrial 54S ribosomal protein uL22m n=1 Tax=Rhizomucor pusillus TaxID=4840 RepID=UPI0037424330
MSQRSLTSLLRPLSQWSSSLRSAQIARFSIALPRLANKEAPQGVSLTSRPDVGASSLFDSVKVEPETAATSDKKEAAKEYRISSANFKARPRKLNMLARQIAGLHIDEAIKQMEFSKKKAAKRILSNLVLARRNAELQKGMKNLVIDQAWVGKGQYRKTVKYHAQGRIGIRDIPRAHIKFIFKEAAPVEQTADKSSRRNIRGWKETKKVWTPLVEDKPIYNPKPFYNW